MVPVMNASDFRNGITRRELLQLSTAGAAMLGAAAAFPRLASAAETLHNPPDQAQSSEQKLYSDLLADWCDGMIARQITAMNDPAFYGGLLCPSCVLIHGRCGDAVHPLLRMAHSTGEAKYLRAALLVDQWSQAMVSRPDGSWVNDVTLSTWQGITVFHAISLAEALKHHGEVLDASTRGKWKDRLAAAAKFLDGFISIETGNVNYPVTSSLAFYLCGQVLGEDHYLERGRGLAHQVMQQFSPDGFLFGEGHPLKSVSAKGCRPVDLGYNVEESLPSLAMYSVLADDKSVQEQVISAIKTHIEFMLPDGAWENSWGTRNYKWSWWGSRTADGCQGGFIMLSKFDPRFREAARRSTELMRTCTHDGLLYGGPDYQVHGDLPCIHHTFTHAKALAEALDEGSFGEDSQRPKLPRDEPYGLKTFPTIATRLAAIGPWRATVTEYDWEYVEHVQAGSGGMGGGHLTGGAMCGLYHMDLGPVLTASMTHYEMIEIDNQQQYRGKPHMPLTARIEYTVGDASFTSTEDFKAVLTAKHENGQVAFDARGRMLDNYHRPHKGGELLYHVTYTLSESSVKMTATASGEIASEAHLTLIVPVVSRGSEAFEQPDAQTVRIVKPKGTLTVHTDAAAGFGAVPKERTFNLVPGLEAIPLAVAMEPGKLVRVRIAGVNTA
ncbi:MAG TPA: twin-arginine translocation signal domain-containing protein [Terracidiphilus sp.]|nr:twin-arginine translocation signal domain-containing protein [Terracidiphilus sp.]